MDDLTQRFRDSIADAGLSPPSEIIPDGQIHRFGSNGKPGDLARWYVFYPDGVPAGSFGCWRTGLTQNWCAKLEHDLTSAEQQEMQSRIQKAQAKRDAEMAIRHSDARTRATEIWESAEPVEQDHPYLVTKNVKAHDVRVSDEQLIVPVRIDGELHSLQFISPDGDKKFLPGGRVKGGYHTIGEIDGAKAIAIAEGYATGASIHEATGLPVAIAFNAGNLPLVAQALRRKYPDIDLILCADDDWKTDGNPGKTKAMEAAKAVGGKVALPVFDGNRPDGATDFNDMAKRHALDAVKRAIENATFAVKQRSDNHQSVELIRASDITPEPISWLWNGWLARGKFHILGGAPGTGKTTIALAFAATVTSGGKWPDGTPCEPQDVIMWSSEDDPGDTLVPRLIAMGANLNRVHFISGVNDDKGQRPFDPAHDIPALREKIATLEGVGLLIVDPIVSAVAVDSNKNAEVRRALQPLVDLAAEKGCALLGITHLSKGTTGKEPVERITGSLAFGALARLVLIAMKQQSTDDNPSPPRLLTRAKSNISADTGGFEYQLDYTALESNPGIETSRLLWGKSLEGSARELMALAEVVEEPAEKQALHETTDWLKTLLLEEGGQINSREVFTAANAMGFSKRTVHRVREKLGLTVLQTGYGKDKRSVWKLPLTVNHANEDQSCQSCQSQSNGINGTIGTNGTIGVEF